MNNSTSYSPGFSTATVYVAHPQAPDPPTGIASGVFRSAKEAADCFVHEDRSFEPDAARHALYREKHALYQAVFPSLKSVLNKL